MFLGTRNGDTAGPAKTWSDYTYDGNAAYVEAEKTILPSCFNSGGGTKQKLLQLKTWLESVQA